MLSHSLPAILDFDRFSVHSKKKEELAAAIVRLEAEVAAAEVGLSSDRSVPVPEHINSYKLLTTYFAFLARDQTKAIQYAEKFKSVAAKDSFDYAEACNLTGNAYMMTGGYSDPVLFVEALTLFDKLATGITDDKTKVLLNINQGFANRYIGLAYHRQSMYSKDVAAALNFHDLACEHYNHALTYSGNADEIQKASQISTLPVIVDIMEIYHLQGVRFIRQKQYQEAVQALENALEKEKEFNAHANTIHFLTYITMQSLAEAYCNIDQNILALKLLDETIAGQTALYGKREHTDIAKSLHFVGMAHANSQEWEESIAAYREALAIKVKELKPNDYMILIGQIELLKAADEYFDFDWNDFISINRNKDKVKFIEQFLASILNLERVRQEDKTAAQAYVNLHYHLGTYYIHIDGNSTIAKEHFDLALKSLTSSDGDSKLCFWIRNHLAFCNQKNIYLLNQGLKELKSKPDAEKRAILEKTKADEIDSAYANFDSVAAHEKDLTADSRELARIIAFAYAVRALVQYEAGELKASIKTYLHSVSIYINYNLEDEGDQYVRVLNRLAMFFEEDHQLKRAKTAYETLNGIWTQRAEFNKENKLPQNIYEARFHDAYATFLENTGSVAEAVIEVRKALKIRRASEPDSPFTLKTAERLEALKKLLPEEIQVSITSYPGSLHASQSPRAASFAGTSVTLPLPVAEEDTKVENTSRGHVIL
jgi:hypothetical protein